MNLKNSENRNHGASSLEHAYAGAFAEFLSTGNEDALHRGYEIGRSAMALGWGIHEVAKLHHAGIARLLASADPSTSFDRNLQRAQQFFAESLSYYEMANRGFRDSALSLRRLNETLELEIQRIAHAVHDEAGQLLFAMRLALDGMAHDCDPAFRPRLQEVGSLLDQVEKQLRSLSHELRPTILDDLGLLPALNFLADRVSKSAGLVIRVRSSLRERCALAMETAIFRIVQEALTNITRHAHAKKVDIQLKRIAGNLECTVRDDGAGFDALPAGSPANRPGLGLIGMRERANALGGSLQIDSRQGHGTNLLVKIPWRET